MLLLLYRPQLFSTMTAWSFSHAWIWQYGDTDKKCFVTSENDVIIEDVKNENDDDEDDDEFERDED